MIPNCPRHFQAIAAALVLFFGGDHSLSANSSSSTSNPAVSYRVRLRQIDADPARNHVQAIAQTDDGYLWIGTQSGLARFDGDRFKFFTHGSLTNQRINALCPDSDGSLWVATGQGLFRIYHDAVTAHLLADSPHSSVLSLQRGENGALWIGSSRGLALYENEKLSLIGDRSTAAPFLERVTAIHAIRAISRSNTGNELWLSSSDNLILLKNDTAVTNLSFRAFKPDFIRSICCRRDGSIWLGSNSGLIGFNDGEYQHFTKADGLPDNTITAVYEDRQGNLWIGAYGGLCRFAKGKFTMEMTPDGEPYDQVVCFFEDRENNLWIGAKDGLYQLNVRQFTSFTTRDGLAHNNVVSVYEDRVGALWIGTWGGGLHCLRDGKLSIYSSANVKAMRNDLVLAIHGSRDGSIWFGEDYDGGLYRFQSGDFQRYGEEQGLRRNAIRALLEDDRGRLLIGRAWEGVGFWSDGKINESWVASALHLDVFTRGKSGLLSQRSFENGMWADWKNFREKLDSDPAIVRGNSNRLDLFYRGTNNTLLHKQWDGQWNAAEDLGGSFQGAPDVCSPSEGNFDVYVRGTDDELWRKYFRNGAWSEWLSLGGILASDPSVVYQGSNRMDVFFLSTNKTLLHQSFEHDQKSEENDLGGICIGGPDACSWSPGHLAVFVRGTNDALWFKTFQNGKWSTYFDTIGGILTSDPAMVSPAVNSLQVFARGADDALYQRSFEGKWLPWKRLGGVLAGAPDVVARYPAKDQLRWDLLTNGVRCFLQTANGTTWVGTEAGLSCSHAGIISTFTKEYGLPDDAIYSLFEDKEKVLWIGTGRGLCKTMSQETDGRNQNRVTRSFTVYRFSEDAILEILEDDFNHLWLATKQGIIRVDKKELDDFSNGRIPEISATSFGKADGMASQICVGVAKPSAIKTRDGRLWFATTKGLAVTDPKLQMAKNDKPPAVIIRAVFTDKKSLQLDGSESGKVGKRESERAHFPTLPLSHLLVPAGRGELEFHYAALSYTEPEKNRFKYQLEGLDPDWVDADVRRTAFYNNVPPGDYTFRVRACNNDGVWNEAGESVKLRLLPHPWQTWWFKGSIMLLGLSFVGVAVRVVTRKRMELKLRHLEQQHAVEKERTRIAQDMHDDLGARLTEILLLGDIATKSKDAGGEAKSNVSRMTNAVRNVARDLDAIIWAVNPSNDSLERLITYIYEYLETLLGMGSIRCRLDVPDQIPDRVLSADIRHNLFLVIKEAVNNIIKHSQATEVRFRLRLDNSILSLSLEDNGKGFSPDSVSVLGNGVQNIQKRMAKIGGQGCVCSAPGKGTRIELKVPLGSF